MVEAQHGGKKCDGRDFEERECTQELELSKKIKSLVDKAKLLNDKIGQLEDDKAKLEDDNKRMQEVIQNCGDENEGNLMGCMYIWAAPLGFIANECFFYQQ